MGANRVFFPQETLDTWLGEGRIQVNGEVLTLTAEGQRFHLRSAVRFLREVAGGGDVTGLVGKVKDVEQLRALGGEHYADSVVLEQNAYEVVEGFVGEPLMDVDATVASGDTLAAAARAAIGDEPGTGDIDLLARFLTSR